MATKRQSKARRKVGVQDLGPGEAARGVKGGLEMENGGLDTTDEAPSFGDPYLLRQRKPVR